MNFNATVFLLERLKAKHALIGLDNFDTNANLAHEHITKSMKLGILSEFVQALENGFVILMNDTILPTKKIGGCREAIMQGYIF